MKVTHIPKKTFVLERPTRLEMAITYCGRTVPLARCIDLRRVCIEDATCKNCQRSDDRRTSEQYRRERAAAKAAGKPFPEDQ